MTLSRFFRRGRNPSWTAAGLLLAAGMLSSALAVQTVLEEGVLASSFVSLRGWAAIIDILGGRFENGLVQRAEIDFAAVLAGVAGLALVGWLVAGVAIARTSHQSFATTLRRWAAAGWIWWLLPGAWEAARVLATLAGADAAHALLAATLPFWFAAAAAGWLASAIALARGTRTETLPAANVGDASLREIPLVVWAAVVTYVVVYTALNWLLYWDLHIPHGDSAMYEEHLWNLTHGKGFRSYLDQGVFLGEHIQVVHVLLVPLYVLWPSHLLLELCESLALAAGAIAVYFIGWRHTRSRTAAVLLSVAYLLYFPMQFVDIAIDLKTFRPIAFGIPLVLFGLDQLERRRYGTMSVLFALALTAKEDYAIVLAPIGLWLCLSSFRRDATAASRPARWIGAAWAIGATAYLAAVVLWIIPWFRGGDAVHYARYFPALGGTPGEILETFFTRPGVVFEALATPETLLYFVAVLAPLGFLPLLSPGRLLVALPLFVTLCLNELARDPRHHFHAPLVPLVFWAAAAGLGRSLGAGRFARHFMWTSALATGFLFSLGPQGRAFWDAGSPYHWRELYVRSERARRFAAVERLIPRDARVASTDFVHPRFTHHERSYDYSDYPRAVNEGKPGAPPDTDYIVIDKQDRYRRRLPPEKQIHAPGDVPEYRAAPDAWRVLYNDEYYLVLQRLR
ncbi:MAG: DUF2079 domain-containing protein [Planctomycetes bacterium]|nr:DUF2079 domain-containing protein [Planctomycetota bacterium]